MFNLVYPLWQEHSEGLVPLTINDIVLQNADHIYLFPPDDPSKNERNVILEYFMKPASSKAGSTLKFVKGKPYKVGAVVHEKVFQTLQIAKAERDGEFDAEEFELDLRPKSRRSQQNGKRMDKSSVCNPNRQRFYLILIFYYRMPLICAIKVLVTHLYIKDITWT